MLEALERGTCPRTKAELVVKSNVTTSRVTATESCLLHNRTKSVIDYSREDKPIFTARVIIRLSVRHRTND